MREDVVGKVDGQIRDVLELVDVRSTGRHHEFRFLADEVVHDGQIMGGQIPEHVDIVLEQSQIDASGVIIVQGSERSIVDQMLDLPYSAGE